MAIYTADTETAYTCIDGEEGSDIVSVFIDQATNEEADTTFEAKFEDGGLTITCSKALAKEISGSFDFAATDGEEDEEEDPELAKALNQLISLVAGKNIAIATNDESDRPAYRVGVCLELASKELGDALAAGDIKALKQCQRKIESMTSLKAIATALGGSQALTDPKSKMLDNYVKTVKNSAFKKRIKVKVLDNDPFTRIKEEIKNDPNYSND